MALRNRSQSRKVKPTHGIIWYMFWPIHVVPRWLAWLLWEFIAGLALGFCQGARIAWHEVRAEKIVAKCKREGTTIYDLDIWRLLRKITFDKQRRKGVVVCAGCNLPTHTPHCHHIKHVAYHPKLAFTLSNLTGLCADCHQDEHPHVKLAGSGLRRSRVPLRRKHRRLAQALQDQG